MFVLGAASTWTTWIKHSRHLKEIPDAKWKGFSSKSLWGFPVLPSHDSSRFIYIECVAAESFCVWTSRSSMNFTPMSWRCPDQTGKRSTQTMVELWPNVSILLWEPKMSKYSWDELLSLSQPLCISTSLITRLSPSRRLILVVPKKTCSYTSFGVFLLCSLKLQYFNDWLKYQYVKVNEVRLKPEDYWSWLFSVL